MDSKEVTERQLRRAYMDAFSTPSGAIVLQDLSNRCFELDTTYVPDFKGAIYINEGKRQVLLTIKTMMNPEFIKQLDDESEKKEE